MDSSLLYFDLFPTFPEEIRLEIWKLSLPEPRIIDLEAKCHDGTAISEWDWELPSYWSTSSAVSLPLLQVSHEARRTTLESYQATSIRQRDGQRWKPAYIDFNKDILFTACSYFNLDFQSNPANHKLASNCFAWLQSAKRLAIPLIAIKPRKPLFWKKNWVKPKPQVVAVRLLATVCTRFPILQQLFLVIDGRDNRFGGTTSILNPSELHADIKNHSGRIDALKAISLIVEDLRSQYLDLNIPQIELALFTNGQDTESLERLWVYNYGLCRILKPGEISFRSFKGASTTSDSSSDEEGDSGEDVTEVFAGRSNEITNDLGRMDEYRH